MIEAKFRASIFDWWVELLSTFSTKIRQAYDAPQSIAIDHNPMLIIPSNETERKAIPSS